MNVEQTNLKIAELTERLQALEDHQEILALLAMHPLSIDGGEGDFWMNHWTEDAVADRLPDPERHSGDYSGVYGKEVMREEIRSPELEVLRKSGICHFATPYSVQIEGARARATNYLQLLGVEDGAYRVRRIVVSRFELRREENKWQITKRVMRPLGHAEALQMMKDGLPLGHA